MDSQEREWDTTKVLPLCPRVLSPGSSAQLFYPLSIALQIKWSPNVSWTTLKQILSLEKEVATKIKCSNVPFMLLSNYN